MSNTRLNFGNGQVEYFASVAAAKRALAELKRLNTPYTEYARVQRYAGDGEWVNAR